MDGLGLTKLIFFGQDHKLGGGSINLLTISANEVRVD